MPDYHPPVHEMRFVLEKVLGFSHPDIDGDMIETVLTEAAKLASEVLAPLPEAHCILSSDGAVATPPGYKEAYRQYCEGGWNAVPFAPDHGGQGLPWALAFPIQEMWQGASLSFGLCPLLNQGAVEAIEAHGSAEQKAAYLPKLIAGEWTGTMNLTEPQAGSDLGAIRAKAVKQPDGTYKITGQKIFITYGEHDFTNNIIHLVLARIPDAPEGSRGISLFIVPKILPDGTRNDVKCAGLEHKLGIHASPTCTMAYGEGGGATGYLVGHENEGLKYMFTMMNNARLSVGLQGVAVAERAYQAALAYAGERMQGGRAIIAYADVKRMLLSMKTQIQAGRILAYEAALMMDRTRAGDTAAQAHVELMTPVVKGWCTDMAVEVTSTGIQVFGGMGFIEETGAARFLRDARILPIYEGTNGIQAADLVFRKIARDGGAAFAVWLAQARKDAGDVSALMEHLTALEKAVAVLLEDAAKKDAESLSAVSAPFLRAFGTIAGGVMMARAEKAGGAKAEFYLRHILPRAAADLSTVVSGRACADLLP